MVDKPDKAINLVWLGVNLAKPGLSPYNYFLLGYLKLKSLNL